MSRSHIDPIASEVDCSSDGGATDFADLPDLPEGLSKKIAPETLRDAPSLDAILNVLSTETGVPIEVRRTRPIAASFTFHAPIPVPAALVLRTAAEAHGLTVRVENGRVVLVPVGR